MAEAVRRLTRNGAHGWLAVAAVVCAWDVVAVVAGGESLSTATRRALANPRGRPLVTAAIAYLVLHFYLSARWRRFDPLCVLAGRLEAVACRARPLHPAEPSGGVGP